MKLYSLTLSALTVAVLAVALPASAAHETPRKPVNPVLDPIAAKTLRDASRMDTRAKPAPAPTLPALSAEKIVERNAAARGGAQKWAAVHSMSVSGKLDAGRERKDGGAVGGMTRAPHQARGEARAMAIEAAKASQQTAGKIIQLPYRADFERPTRMRAEVDFEGKTAVQVWNGTEGWKVRPFLGRDEVEPYTADEKRMAQAQQQLDGPLINHRAKGIDVALDGTERVDGHDCYRLKLKFKNGDERRVWVDGSTFLEVKAEEELRHFNGKDRMVYTLFRDYRPENGLMVAHQLETQIDGVAQTNKIYIDKVALNPKLEPARFVKPQIASAGKAAQ